MTSIKSSGNTPFLRHEREMDQLLGIAKGAPRKRSFHPNKGVSNVAACGDLE